MLLRDPVRLAPRPVSVLALVTEAYGGYGGIAQYNCDLLDALRKNPEIKDIMVVARRETSAPRGPRRRLRIINPRGRLVGFVFGVLAHAMLRRFDIVFCGHINFVPLAALIARIHGARLILQTHGIDAWNAPEAWNRYTVAQADLVLCVSRFTRARLLSWSDIDPERVVVVGNTYRDEFSIADAKKIRTPHGLEEKTVLLTVGRLDGRQKHKGHDRVIRCLPRLRHQHPDIVYVIVGEGNDRERLQNLAAQCEVASMIRFPGRVSDRELVDFYRAADLFVMPSTGDGFGIVFLEAMACGTPVLGVDVGGVRDAMADGDLGLAVQDDGFEEALDRAIALRGAPRPELSNRVRARFGRTVFDARIDAVIRRVSA